MDFDDLNSNNQILTYQGIQRFYKKKKKRTKHLHYPCKQPS